MPTGDVEIAVNDGQGGVASAPLSSVQAVLGCSSIGTPFQIVATRNPSTLVSNLGYGPLVEAASLTCLAGGVVLAVKVPLTSKGVASSVTHTGTGTSAVTTTLDGTNGAFDDYNVKVIVPPGGAGTIGTGPCAIQVSLDAGRNFGPVIQLGTATTYIVSNTGITLNFGAGTLVVGDAYTFHTTGPKWQDTDVQKALQTLAGSQYGVVGWGSTHLVGNANTSAATTGGVPGADASTIEGYADSLATGFNFTRIILSARDSGPPVAYGGSAESDAAWYGSLSSDYAAVSARRICATGGYYNMPTAIGTNASAGAPRYRRSGAWALAARQVTIPPQRMASRVKDGALTQIVVDPTNDPLDGFNYHDDGPQGPLDTARFAAFRTRKGQTQGFFVSHPNLMSPVGSDFNWLPRGNVIDIASALINQIGAQFIDDDMRVNPNGTLFENDARQIETVMSKFIDSVMLAQGMVSGPCLVTVDRSANVSVTSKVPVTVTIFGRGYIDELDAVVGFNNPLTA